LSAAKQRPDAVTQASHVEKRSVMLAADTLDNLAERRSVMLMLDADTRDNPAERQSVMLRLTQRLRQDVATQVNLAESFVVLQRLLPKLLLRLKPSQRHDVVTLDSPVARPSVMRMPLHTLLRLLSLPFESIDSIIFPSHNVIAHFTSTSSILLSTHLLV
jgi:hypothetical protein